MWDTLYGPRENLHVCLSAQLRQRQYCEDPVLLQETERIICRDSLKHPSSRDGYDRRQQLPEKHGPLPCGNERNVTVKSSRGKTNFYPFRLAALVRWIPYLYVQVRLQGKEGRR